jgi:hypothetical protein
MSVFLLLLLSLLLLVSLLFLASFLLPSASADSGVLAVAAIFTKSQIRHFTLSIQQL